MSINEQNETIGVPGHKSLEPASSLPGTTKDSENSTLQEPAPVIPPVTNDAPVDNEYISGLRLVAVVGATTIMVFLLLLDQSILSTAIPQITSEFHSIPDVGWYTGVYQLASATFQPLTGKFYSNFRAKWVFLVMVFIFEVGSLLCGAAQTSGMFIAGRTIAGLGSSGLVNGGITIIAGAAPMDKRPFYTGIMIGIGQLGMISGPLIGGALTQYTTWRWCFYINLPLGAVAALAMVMSPIPNVTVKEPFSLQLVRKVIPQLDLIGFSLLAPAIVMLLLALQFGGGQVYAWSSSVIIGLFVGAGVTAIIFTFWERRVGDDAMIPASIVGNRIVMASTGFMLCTMACTFVSTNYIPLYFQAVKGVGPTLSGVYMLPSILSSLIFVVTSGAFVSKIYGYYLPWVIASSSINAVGNGLISTFDANTSTGKWVGYQLIMGASRGMGIQMPMIATQAAVSPAQIPITLSVLIFGQNLGAAVAVVIGTVIFTQSLVDLVPKYAPSVSPKAVLVAGASGSAVRALVPEGSPELEGVLRGFSIGFDRIFYLLAALAGLAFAFSWGMGWKDIRKKPETPAKATEEEEKRSMAEV